MEVGGVAGVVLATENCNLLLVCCLIASLNAVAAALAPTGVIDTFADRSTSFGGLGFDEIGRISAKFKGFNSENEENFVQK